LRSCSFNHLIDTENKDKLSLEFVDLMAPAYQKKEQGQPNYLNARSKSFKTIKEFLNESSLKSKKIDLANLGDDFLDDKSENEFEKDFVKDDISNFEAEF